MFKKLLLSTLFSVMIVFMPFSVSLVNYSPTTVQTIQHARQLTIALSYSACEALNKDLWSWDDSNNKPSKNKQSKKEKKEASFFSKAFGFVLGIVVCQFLIINAEALSFTVFRNGFNSVEDAYKIVGFGGNSDRGPWFGFGLLTGFLYFIGRCALIGLIVNLFTVSSNVMGFIRWFDYAYYAILLFHFCSIRLVQILGMVFGCFLGTFFMEKLFG